MKDNKKQIFEESFDHLDESIIEEFVKDETASGTVRARKSFLRRLTSRPALVAASLAVVIAFAVAAALLLRPANAVPNENSVPQAEESSPQNSYPSGQSEPEFSAEPYESEEPYLSEEPNESEEEYSAYEESGQENGPVYVHVKKGVSYLSAEEFASSRVGGEVSEGFIKHYSSFSVNLLKECAKGKSALVSPLSALTALQMVANGARGSTAEEMQKTLGGALTTEQLNQELFNYYDNLQNRSFASLKSANAIWMTDREDFTVNTRFVDIINETFRATLACAPFTENSTVDAINDWCKDNTDGMIPKIFEYGDLSYDTIMVLLNALSFDAEWASQYSDNSCVDMTFHGETHDTTVKMMFSSEGNYISGEHETGFVKYYKGYSYAFAAILPEEGMSMEEYLACLDGEKLCKLLDFGRKEVNAGLPEFSFDWSGSLKDALKEMGIKQAFDRTADFSYLGAMENGSGLFINSVHQKTHIEVDQSGTRAAAVTEVEVVPEEEPDEIYEVILDRPFVYAIIDMQSRLPVFIGCLTDIG